MSLFRCPCDLAFCKIWLNTFSKIFIFLITKLKFRCQKFVDELLISKGITLMFMDTLILKTFQIPISKIVYIFRMWEQNWWFILTTFQNWKISCCKPCWWAVYTNKQTKAANYPPTLPPTSMMDLHADHGSSSISGLSLWWPDFHMILWMWSENIFESTFTKPFRVSKPTKNIRFFNELAVNEFKIALELHCGRAQTGLS